MDENDTPIKLPKKQDLFCRYYVSNGHNGTKAAEDAGYKKNSARITASKLLTKANIQEFIKQLEKPVKDKLEIDENWVLTKLKRYSDANIMDYFEITTQKIERGTGKQKKTIIIKDLQLKDLSKLPREITDCIQEISQTAQGLKIKLVDKRPSTEAIGKSLGMFKEQIEGTFNHNVESKVYVIPAFGSGGVNDSPNKQPG